MAQIRTSVTKDGAVKMDTASIDVTTLVKDRLLDRTGKMCNKRIQNALSSVGIMGIKDLEFHSWVEFLQEALDLAREFCMVKEMEKIERLIEELS